MFAKCDTLPKGDVLVHLCLRESILAIPFWNFNHPTYQKLEVPESRSTFRHLCIKSRLHHAHPFVAAAEKDCVMQRSRGFGHGVVVPRIVIQYTDCALSCAMRLLQTNDSIVEIELLATVSWTCGCQPFSCRCLQNVVYCRKEDVLRRVCLRNPSLPFLVGILSLHSLPEAWASWERQYAPPALQWWSYHAHTFLAAAEKNSLTQRSRGFGHGVVAYKICYVQYSDCVRDLDCRFCTLCSQVWHVTAGKVTNSCRNCRF